MKNTPTKKEAHMTQSEAIDYLKKVLTWENFIKGHHKIKLAIECVLRTTNQNKEKK